MTKATKKKNRRMRKMLRKTLGTLFLVSAIVVAAIPVDGLRAANNSDVTVLASRPAGEYKVTIEAEDTKIPVISTTEPIYTTADGSYQFAYVSTSGSSQKFAVILGYNKLNVLAGNKLEIPEEVDAYVQYTHSEGTTKGYVAVGKSNNPLFYEYKWTEYVDQEVEDPENPGSTIIQSVPVEKKELRPCYVEDITNWENTNRQDFYYETTTNSSTEYPGYAKTTTEDYQRIQGAMVRYIANQYLEQDADGNWHVAGEVTEATKAKGIFADCGNIVDLTVGENLLGIGNYAFWHCTGLKSITLGNGVNTIGNNAFSDCANMQSINMPVNSNISMIGSRAFYNCRALQSFVMPASVSAIGDSAFEGCTAMTSVDLCSAGQNNVLSELGWDVFKDCESLKSITFPASYSETVDISMFAGCKNLRYITAQNKNLTFSEADGVYTYELFKAMLEEEPVAGTFYFEGFKDSELHKFSKENCFAFSYIDSDGGVFYKLDKYELTVEDENTGGKTTYVVNASNQLIACSFDQENGVVETLEIPKNIGPYGISQIDSGVFQNKCNLKKVVIPETVSRIQDNAFKGCHNLADVIFESGNVTIGADAFKTQENTAHTCNGGVETVSGNEPLVKLSFTGPISENSGPYVYAMSSSGRYNASGQTESFITYYSGWPQNLKVHYDYDPVTKTGKSMLADYPAYTELQGKYTQANYPYITAEHEQAANEALAQYTRDPASMTENQRAIINAALALEIPDAVQSIKDGLFKEKENKDGANIKKTITAYGLDEIPDYAFEDCDSLQQITLLGNTTTIGEEAFRGCDNLEKVEILGTTATIEDHAFLDCVKLTDVSITDSVSKLGVRPFAGCEILDTVNFQNSPYYVCENSIIFGLNNGVKDTIVQCLEGRDSKYVRSSDVAGITKLEPEAFMGSNVREVDLTDTTVTTIPSYAFADTPELRTVKLPYTCQMISDYAFDGSNVDYIEAPVALTLLDQNAFVGLLNPNSEVTFCCEPDSYIYKYAKLNGFDTTDMPIERYYTVTFWDWDSELGKNVIVNEQDVKSGEDAVPPTPRGKAGYVFTKWDPDYREIYEDTFCMAVYDTEPEDHNKFKVVFVDYDGTELSTVYVVPGGTAEPPKDPTRAGYTFVGWDRVLTNVQESFTTMAMYEEVPVGQFVVRYIDKNDNVIYTARVNPGEDAPAIQAPEVEGYRFTGWRPGLTGITKDTDTYAQYEKIDAGDPDGDGGNDGNDDNNGNNGGGNDGDGDNSGTTQTYFLIVVGGTGTGSYVAGSERVIAANDPAAGMEFSSWTVEPSDVKIASKTQSATVITMPAANVTVTANYKAKTNSGGSSGGNNSGTNKPNSNAGAGSGGTTVVIDKNGLSNTGVVSATVNGSSDNFTIKITESSAAATAAVNALRAEYGDLDNIKYFPMDISLYDSTGTKKITDTTGLSISITLPLPDSLITYAGNNKVAGIVNDRLDKLTTKFTTINGVSCVTFTAEHFSPYVIYVDTENLTAGTADSTPKTGDGIHPKWFLSIGLACISMVLFMKKDKKVVRKAVA